MPAWIFSLLLLLGLTAPHLSPALIRAENATPLVITVDEQLRMGVCSGMVVGAGVVLTTAHCLDNDPNPLVLVDGKSALPLVVDRDHDLVKLRVTLPRPVLTFRATDGKLFEHLYGMGYPAGFPTLVALPVEVIATETAIPLDGDLSALGMLVKGEYINGMSGGPVVDGHGEVVGIVQASGSGIGFGMRASTIQAFLKAVH